MKLEQRESIPWRTFGNRRKKLHKFRKILSGSFEKYIQTLVRRASSDFKTPRNSLKMLGGSLPTRV